MESIKDARNKETGSKKIEDGKLGEDIRKQGGGVNEGVAPVCPRCN